MCTKLLEETINRVRRGPFDLRAANAVGFLASILLKALGQRVEERLAHLEAVMTARQAQKPKRLISGPRRKQPPMKSRSQRLKAIELTLTPEQVVLLWLRNALQAGTFEEGGRTPPN
jgi:hypothetical protein